LKFELSKEEESLLKRMRIKSTLPSVRSYSGWHTSSGSGFNIEFSEYESYHLGDDLKYLDWKVAAKTERLYLKKFDEEKTITGIILLDSSSSMEAIFPGRQSANLSKLEAGKKYAIYLAYWYYYNKEILGFASFHEKLENFIEAGNSPSKYQRLYNQLSNLQSGNTSTRYKEVFTEAVARIPAKSQIYIISDYYTESASLMSTLRVFKYKNCKISVINIIDSNEYNLNNYTAGTCYFIDSESKRAKFFNSLMMKKRYNEFLHKHFVNLKIACVKNQVEYCRIFTGQSIFKQFLLSVNS